MTEPTTPDPDEDPRILTTLGRVNRALSRPVDESDPEVVDAVAAVCSLVPTWLAPRGDLGDDGLRDWAAHQRYGAALLAARLYRRKDSPGGMGGFGDTGPGYVQSNWPDIAMLLGLGAYAVGRVG
jgi:hypothetical protein